MSIYSLQTIASEFADSLVLIDKSGIPFRNYSPGVGPYGEPQLLKKIVQLMNSNPDYKGRIETKREPDLLFKGYWAIGRGGFENFSYQNILFKKGYFHPNILV